MTLGTQKKKIHEWIWLERKTEKEEIIKQIICVSKYGFTGNDLLRGKKHNFVLKALFHSIQQ